ncbi:MAG: NAD-dependent epimerase/dehydratase family protein [Candidatus Saccharimonadales bacterium]
MAKCLVLGANGFLGSHVTDALVKQGHSVRVFDRFKAGTYNFQEHADIEIAAGDFLNRHDIKQAVKDIEYVFHFISTTTPATAEDDPLIDIETNIQMSIELFQECVDANIKKVIFASTGGAIYGENSSEHVSENIMPLPISPYAIGKLTIEHYLRYFQRKFGLGGLVFRISNPYGERQSLMSKQGVIPIFLQHIAKDEPITILGDGSMVRDYIYVKDMAAMIVKSFEGAKEDVYNLGSGHGLSVNELVEAVRTITGKPVEANHAKKPTTYVEKVVLDISRYTDEFPNAPQTSIEDGLKATWEYVRHRHSKGGQ